MKKLLSLCMCIVFIVTLLPQAIAAPNPNTEDDLTYAFNEADGTLTISGIGVMIERPWSSFKDKIKKVIIEEGVTCVGEKAFEDCTVLESVSIPQSATYIVGYAFDGCTALEEITIPESITKIGTGAFQRSGLKSISIPDSVTQLSRDAFYGCTALKSVKLPKYITKIEAWTFYGCTALEEIAIPEGVTEIGDYAFQECTALTTVKLPSSMEIIGWDVFKGCTSLENINLPYSVSKISHRAFEGCSSLESIIIPPQVDDVFADTFKNCTSLKTVIIAADDEDEKAIGTAFNGCTALEKVVVPETVTYIGEDVFKNCGDVVVYCVENSPIHEYAVENNVKFEFGEILASGTCGDALIWYLDDKGTLTIGGIGDTPDFSSNAPVPWDSVKETVKKLVIEEGVTRIGEYAFKGHTALNDVTLPKGLTSIGGYAFEDCAGITSITIPESVVSIGHYAFRNCSSLTVANVPYSVTEMTCAFIGSALYNGEGDAWEDGLLHIGRYLVRAKEDIVTANIKESTTHIDNRAFMECKSLKSVTIPEGLEKIGNYAFRYCESLESVVIPDSVKGIGSATFYGCTALKEITIGKGVEIIDDNAFEKCESLVEVNLPDSVKEISYRAFMDCPSLKKITIPASVTVIGDTVFGSFNATVIYCEPDSTAHVYAKFNKLNYRFIGDTSELGDVPLSGMCGENAMCTLDSEGTLTISATGYEDAIGTMDYVPWSSDYKDKIKKVVIEEGIKSLNTKGLHNLVNMKELVLPGGLKLYQELSEEFKGCTALEKITIADNLAGISEATFVDSAYYKNPDNWEGDLLYIGNYLIACKNKEIASVNIKQGTKCIAAYAFQSCTKLESVTFPNTLVDIGEGAFMYCEKLKDIRLPDGLIRVGEGAFGGTADYFDESNWVGDIFYIGRYALDAYRSIVDAKIRVGTVLISDGSFDGNYDLKTVEIPVGVKFIGDRAFRANYLEKVSIPNGVVSIGDDAFAFADVKEIILPDSVTHLGDGAFQHCFDLTTIKLPSNITRIGNYLLNETQIKEIIIPSTVKSIGKEALRSCANLEEVVIPSGVKSIGGSSFVYCRTLKRIEIPRSVTDISDYAFTYCPELTIYCYENSAAHQYAELYGKRYELLPESAAPTSGGGASKPKQTVGLTNFKAVNEYKNDFNDVAADAWYQDSVKTAYELDLVKGAGEGKFNPDGNMTIAEAITLAARLHSIYNTGKADFVQGDIWYQVYVDYAIEKGIITTDQFTDFNAPATRTQFAEIFAKAIAERDYNAINNIKAGEIPDVAENDAVHLLYNAGIVAGSDEKHSFLPDSNIKRSEVATIITRITDKEKRVTFSIVPSPRGEA